MMFLFKSLTKSFTALLNQDSIHKYCQEYVNLPKDPNTFGQRRLRILLLTPYAPFPAYTGASIRRFEHVKYLGTHHHLVLASFVPRARLNEVRQAVRNYCELVILINASPRIFFGRSKQPRHIKLYKSRQMWQVLNKLRVVDFDVVFIDSIFMAQYLPLFPKSFSILSEHNIESQLLQRTLDLNSSQLTLNEQLYSWQELQKLKAYEMEQWPKFSLITVVSEKDKQFIESQFHNINTIIVKNGVDTENIKPLLIDGSRKILFIGTMAYGPNIDAVLFFRTQILPILWCRAPEICFCIAGRNPSRTIRSLANHPQIEVIANPKDIRSVAQNCIMSVVPLRIGGGTRLKILESMAMGLPIVSTSLGCEGLTLQDNEHLLIRDQPESFAEGVLEIIQDPTLRYKLQYQGRQLVEREYNWEMILSRFEHDLLNKWFGSKTAI